MAAYKPLDGSGPAGTALAGSLGLKPLDGTPEDVAATARRPFDTAGTPGGGGTLPAVGDGPTPFFGDQMSQAQLELLVHPENDPAIVDLRQANTFVVENLKNPPDVQSVTPPTLRTTDGVAKGAPIPPAKAVCDKLPQRLAGYLNQREKFHKTVLLAQEQVQVWETANRDALLAAVKDGVEFFVGQWLETFTKRGEVAERLQRIYQQHAVQMATDGVNLVAVETKIRRLQQLTSAGTAAAVTAQANDWQTFLKDGTSALLNQLTASNAELQDLFKDPTPEKYFTQEKPELNALLDLTKMVAAQKTIAKWVAKRLPTFALAELAVKQTYNGWDFYLSYTRLAEANKINGGVLEAAKYLQKRIDETVIEIRGCS